MKLRGKSSSLVLLNKPGNGLYIGKDQSRLPLWLTSFCKALEDTLTPNQIVDSAALAQTHLKGSEDNEDYGELLYFDFVNILATHRYRAH